MTRKNHSWTRFPFVAACAALLLSPSPARGQALFQEKTSANATSITGTNWTTPTNIQTDNGAYASYNNTAQDWLVVKTFGFSIPTASVIDGIQVVVQGYSPNTQTARRAFDAALTKDGSTAAGSAVLALQMPNPSDADVAVSSAGAFWNTTWTAADLNSGNFGVMFRDNNTTAHVLYFDSMTVTAHYRTIDDITVTPTAMAPATIAQGSDYAVEKLSLATNANSATWTAVTITKTGTLADGSVTAVKIYLDANANGTYESASDTLVSSGADAFTAGSAAVTLSAPQTITTTAKVYFVVYNLATLAAVGGTIGATVGAGALTVTYPDTALATNLPASSGNSTVTDGADTVTVTPTDQAGASVAQSADYSVERLSLATNQETATWTAVTVTKTGTLADAKITTVKIYLDANANGTYEAGSDTLISPAVTTFSGGSAAVTLSAAQTITTTAQVYFVVYSLEATATPGATVGGSVAAGALTVTGPALVASTNLPANSTNSSVTDVADTITVTPTGVAPANIVQGGDFALEKLSLATGGDEATWTAINVTRTGSLVDGDVATVKIYIDDGSGTYDGADTLISPAVTAFSGGAAAITLSAAQTITTTPKVYFVVYTLQVTATVTNTIGAQVSVGALTATAPDSVAATNLPANSSNATVIALGDTITVTPTDMAPGTIAQGTANTAMQKLSLVTNANSATWTDITVTKSGTLADAQVTTVKIYLDANANGTFESASDTLISPAVNTFSAGLAAITLSASQTINTTPKVYFVVYTLEAYAPPGATIGASVAANTALTVTSPDIVATANFPANSSNATVTDVADTVTVTPTSMAPGSVAQATDYAVEKLSMATGADEAIWTAVTVTKTGTLADAGVTTVKIYLDANANGTYESGSDTLISPGVTTFSGGSAAITLSAAQTLTSTAKVYFIVYTLATTATEGATIGASVGSNADVTVSGADAVAATNFPATSANSTVTDAADTITVTPTNMAAGSVAQSSDYAVEKLSLVTNQETASWTALTVAKTGTLADTKITTVKIYLDANANGTYESGSDTLISPGVTTFSGGSAAVTLSAAQTITTTPKAYFIVYVLDVEATIGATVGAQVASGALTAAAPDAVATTNLPANSTNSSVTDAADTIAVTPTDVVGAQFGQGETKALLRLSMATGADSAAWTAITINKLGNLADGSVTTIRIYLDDGDDVFDSALDTLVSPSANTFTAGSVAITLSAAQTLTATPKVYWVVYQLSVSATVGNTIGARVNAAGSLTITAPDGVSGAFPMDSTAATVAAPDTVTAVPTSLAPASIGQGADYAVEKLSLTTNGNTASWTAVKVTLSGTINRTNVTAVKVYLDAGTGDYGNEDTLLAAGTFGGAGNVTLTLSPAQTITTTAKVYFIVYTLNAATPVGNTVGASVAAAADMTIASPDTMATTNFPANSSNSTVDLPDYGVTVSPSIVTVGSVALNQNYIVTTGVTVTNVGNMGTTYELKATTVTAGSPWVIAATPGTDQFTMQGLFHSAQPVVGDYTASDRILDSATACLGGKFEGDRSCQQVRPGNVRTLWLNVGMPTNSSTEAVQDFKIDVTATIP
ncbi:MAG: hypothetical protein HYV14_17100 [Elusimicrobia bacterium]|nr:hypothetical protein [Elusimicrobiota bacterium]